MFENLLTYKRYVSIAGGVSSPGDLTCSLTLAVSRGKVTRSATQPAVPAENTLTAADGGGSALLPPAMIN